MCRLGVRREDGGIEEGPTGDGELHERRATPKPAETDRAHTVPYGCHRIHPTRKIIQGIRRGKEPKISGSLVWGSESICESERDDESERYAPVHQRGKHRMYVCSFRPQE